MKERVIRAGRRSLVLAVVLGTQLAPVAEAAPAERFWWQPPVLIDPPAPTALPGERLALIACASSSLCIAADGLGNVATSTNPAGDVGSWSLGRVDDDTLSCGSESHQCAIGFSSLSCPSTSLCVAVDLAGDVFWTTDPAAGPASWSSAKITSTELSAVSCPSTSLCVAVDYSGDAVTSTSPTSGAAGWHVTKIDEGPCPNPDGCYGIGSYENRALNAVSCASASLCVAVDWEGNVITSNDPTGGAGAWRAAYVDGKTTFGIAANEGNAILGSVACPSSSLCLASDSDENVLASKDPSGGAGAWKLTRVLTTAHGLSDLTCPSALLCLALGGGVPSEAILTEQPADGSGWSGVTVEQTGTLRDISCPSNSMCMAVDESGNVIAGPAFSDASIKGRLRAAMTADRRPPSIHALLRSGRITATFIAPGEGTLLIHWRLERAGRVTRFLVAGGQQRYTRTGGATIAIALSKAGMKLLEHDAQVHVAAEGAFYPSEGTAVRATREFTLGS
jgi:hypothetical protein